MKSCANCGLCYVDPRSANRDVYRCMRGVREPIDDLFVLGRVRCSKYIEVEIVLDIQKK